MELSSGKILNNRYQIIRPLARGGFGQTFLANDRHLPDRNQCVIKQFKPQSNDPETIETARRLFATEAKTLHEVGNHPRIPRLFAYFEEGREFFLVQEYIEGEDLATEIDADVYTGDEGKVVALLIEILEILDFVHQKQVIHRDLNPFNLIRRQKDHQLVLIDFGAVKQITTRIAREGKTVSTVAIGTPGYFPSEQAHGHPRFSSDIYALGIIGLQALTGKNPEEIQLDPHTGEISWQHLATTTAEFSYVLDRMIRYDFRERYLSATEVLVDLRKLSKHHRLTGGATYAVKPHVTAAKKSQSWLAKALVILGLIGLTTGGYLGFDSWKTSRNALDLYYQGNTLYELKRYLESLKSYREAVKLNPNYAEAFQGQADALLALGKYQEALDSYEKAIQISPDSSGQAWVGRGQALEKLGKNQEALDSFDRALEINPSTWQAWQGKAVAYLELQQYSSANKSLDKLLTFKAENDVFWYQKGWALQNLKDYEGAIQAYDKALALKPDNPNAWYQKGNCLNNLNKLPEALENYTKAVQFNPDFSQAWYSQGIIFQKLKRNEEALNAFSRATQADSRYYQAWMSQGGLLHQLGQYNEAINAYQKASRLNPTKAESFIGIGNAWYRSSKYSDAINAYQKAIQRQKDNPDTWRSLGDSWFNLGQYGKAITAYDLALRYRSTDPLVKAKKQEAENRQREAIEAGNIEKPSPTQ